jgi:hypothetical protein
MTIYPLHTGDRVAEDARLIAQLGVATATEVAPATLAVRLLVDALASGSAMLGPPRADTWTTV